MVLVPSEVCSPRFGANGAEITPRQNSISSTGSGSSMVP